jgi:hypothetical protein
MILLTNSPKGSNNECLNESGPTLLKLATLDGTTDSKIDSNISHVNSIIKRSMFATATSWLMSNTSPPPKGRNEGTTISRRSKQSTVNTTDRSTDNKCRPQDTTSDILPISTVEKCTKYLPPTFTLQNSSRPILKSQSNDQETNFIVPLEGSAFPSNLSTTVQSDHHECLHRDMDSTTKSVRFDSVHIREHSITVRDLDGIKGTITVTLDWPHTLSSRSLKLDEYESIRQRQGRSPRGRLRKIQHWRRKQLVRQVGGFTKYDSFQGMGYRQQ